MNEFAARATAHVGRLTLELRGKAAGLALYGRCGPLRGLASCNDS